MRNAKWDFDLQTADFTALYSALDALSTDSIALCSAQQVRVRNVSGGCLSLDIFVVWRDLAFSLQCHLPFSLLPFLPHFLSSFVSFSFSSFCGGLLFNSPYIKRSIEILFQDACRDQILHWKKILGFYPEICRMIIFHNDLIFWQLEPATYPLSLADSVFSSPCTFPVTTGIKL